MTTGNSISGSRSYKHVIRYSGTRNRCIHCFLGNVATFRIKSGVHGLKDCLAIFGSSSNPPKDKLWTFSEVCSQSCDGDGDEPRGSYL